MRCIEGATHLLGAIRTIDVADAATSLDNVVAVARGLLVVVVGLNLGRRTATRRGTGRRDRRVPVTPVE